MYKRQDSIIRITQSRVPDIDPAKGSDLSCSIAYVNLYDALVSINLNNEIVPQLAKTWEHSADGLEWTFKLREDVTFHDGTPLTAVSYTHLDVYKRQGKTRANDRSQGYPLPSGRR